jgi:hypothetical protein
LDESPFFEFNITDIKTNQIEEIKKFQKEDFNIERITSAAKELKYMNLFRQEIENEFKNPSAELTKLFLAKINYTKPKTEERAKRYSELLKRTIEQYINDILNDRLQRAMAKESESEQVVVTPIIEKLPDGVVFMDGDGIVTTEDELRAFRIVQAIICQRIPAARIQYKDTRSYFSIFLDKATNPVCRLFFDKNPKKIGLFHEESNFQGGAKTAIIKEINSLEDIYNYSNELYATVEAYDNKKVKIKEQDLTNIVE